MQVEDDTLEVAVPEDERLAVVVLRLLMSFLLSSIRRLLESKLALVLAFCTVATTAAAPPAA